MEWGDKRCLCLGELVLAINSTEAGQTLIATGAFTAIGIALSHAQRRLQTVGI
jgi:hypothetical protein